MCNLGIDTEWKGLSIDIYKFLKIQIDFFFNLITISDGLNKIDLKGSFLNS